MLLRSSACFLILSFVACIDAPSFGENDDLGPSGSATATNPHPGMVLVPAATLGGDGSIAPLDKDDDNEGKGKGGGKPGGGDGGDGKSPPPPPAPASITV